MKLSEVEIKKLIKRIDSNSDGVLTKEEFLNSLDPPLQIKREYKRIMGNINIQNPLVLEERILDLKFRSI